MFKITKSEEKLGDDLSVDTPTKEVEIFDITKVRFKGYLQGLKEGCVGYVADTLSELYDYVVHYNSIYYRQILKIMEPSEYPFVCGRNFAYRYFYLVKEPEEKKYRSFTWEEREQLRGKWLKWVNSSNEEKEFQVTSMKLLTGNKFVINNGITPDILLEKAQFIEGTPCGVEMSMGHIELTWTMKSQEE